MYGVDILGRLSRFFLRVDADCAAQILADPKSLCRIVMVCTMLGELSGVEPQVGWCSEIEKLSRNFCFAMHLKRTSLLNKINGFSSYCY